MIKDSSDPSQFIFEINVGKMRFRLRILSDVIFKNEYIHIESRSKSDPTLSDIVKNNNKTLKKITNSFASNDRAPFKNCGNSSLSGKF